MKLNAAILILLVSLGATVAFAQAPDWHHHGFLQNVVVIFQENRTPDNLFGSNPNFLPGVDIATSGVNSLGSDNPADAGTPGEQL